MLNELHELVTSMKKAGVDLQLQDERFKPYAQKRTYLAYLGHAGQITGVRFEAKREAAQRLLKFEASTGGSRPSTPGFNVPPLFKARDGMQTQYKKLVKQLLKENDRAGRFDLLEQLTGIGQSGWDKKRNNITKNLQQTSALLAQEISEGNDSNVDRAMPFLALLERVQKLNADTLRDALVAILRRQVTDPGPYDSPEHAAKLLFQKDAVVVFDVADPESFDGYSAHHASVQSAVRAAVHAKKWAGRTASLLQGVFGQPVYDTSAKLPGVNLPVLGEVKLRSLNKQRGCQSRYTRIEGETCPVGEELAEEMAAALRRIGAQDWERKTWARVTAACGYPAILFAYPSEMCPDPPELAELFGGTAETNDSDGAKFEACAARVVPALHGIVKEHPNAQVEVFVLLKRDPARTRVHVGEKYRARRLIDCAKSWQNGAGNVPRIVLNIGTRTKPVVVTPLIPFPTELVACINVLWLQNATRADAVSALDIDAGLSLLMQEHSQEELRARQALTLAINNATPLLLAMGHADCRRDGKVQITGKYPKHRRLLPCVLGLLLAKLGSLKGAYMHQSPFLVGRMLSLADTLHKAYCVHHRKDVPSQLIGNATMGVALDSPVAALARLAERLPVYQSWANTTNLEKGWAGWALAEMGKLSPQLAETLKPEPCDEMAKAQMLLGYLARQKSQNQGGEAADKSPNNKETNDGQ